MSSILEVVENEVEKRRGVVGGKYSSASNGIYVPQTNGEIGWYSEIFAKYFDDARLRYPDVDALFWANYTDGVLEYLPYPTVFSYTVPADTTAGTTYLVANGKVIQNWNTTTKTDVTGTLTIPNLLNRDHCLVLSGNIRIEGATAAVNANVKLLPALLRNANIPEELTVDSIANLWGQYAPRNLLPNNVTGSPVTIDTTVLDRTGVKCRDVALVINVATAPATDITVSLSITGKKVLHKWE